MLWMLFSIPPPFFSFFYALPCKRTQPKENLRPHTQRHGFQNIATQYSPLDTSSVPLTLLFLMFRSHPAMMSPDLDSLWPPNSFWVSR